MAVSDSRRDHLDPDVIYVVVLGVISWTLGFILVRKVIPNRSFEFCNRVVSTVHACLAVTLASISVQDWRCPICPLASKSSPFQVGSLIFVLAIVVLKKMQTLAVSCSYLIYDMVCCYFDKKMSLDNTIHHLVSIVGFAAGFAYQKCGSEMVAALWIAEISSPFLHLRENLKEMGYRGTDLNLVADIGFAVIFSFARMVGGPYLTYMTLSATTVPFLIKAMALGLQLVSAYWFYKIVRMIRFKLNNRSTLKKNS